MPEAYPYIISNNKIEPILARARTASKPARFSKSLLDTWGFGSSNDRAITGILKELGFLHDNGTPTEFYDRLRDPNDWRYVLAERMRELYADLFSIDANINAASDEEIKGAISRVTGKEEESVKRYFSTFKTLAALAKFEPKSGKDGTSRDKPKFEPPEPPQPPPPLDEGKPRHKTEYHYNIQIHLPVTTDVTVYNAIFKSLRDNLGV